MVITRIDIDTQWEHGCSAIKQRGDIIRLKHISGIVGIVLEFDRLTIECHTRNVNACLCINIRSQRCFCKCNSATRNCICCTWVLKHTIQGNNQLLLRIRSQRLVNVFLKQSEGSCASNRTVHLHSTVKSRRQSEVKHLNLHIVLFAVVNRTKTTFSLERVNTNVRLRNLSGLMGCSNTDHSRFDNCNNRTESIVLNTRLRSIDSGGFTSITKRFDQNFTKQVKSCRVCELLDEISPVVNRNCRLNNVRVILVVNTILDFLRHSRQFAAVTLIATNRCAGRSNNGIDLSNVDLLNISSTTKRCTIDVISLLKLTSNILKSQDVLTITPEVNTTSSTDLACSISLFNQFSIQESFLRHIPECHHNRRIDCR